eukprot:scaffold74818_cov73-Phaeocystis_antarctica.AAC.3
MSAKQPGSDCGYWGEEKEEGLEKHHESAKVNEECLPGCAAVGLIKDVDNHEQVHVKLVRQELKADYASKIQPRRQPPLNNIQPCDWRVQGVRNVRHHKWSVDLNGAEPHTMRFVLGARVHRRAGHLGEDPAGSFHSQRVGIGPRAARIGSDPRAKSSCGCPYDAHSGGPDTQEAPKRRCNRTVHQRHRVPSFVPQYRHVLAARWNAQELRRAQQLVRPAEHVQRGHCDQLGHLEVHGCGKELPWRAAEVDEELERRRARRHCGRDERAVGDAAYAADRSVLLDPTFHVSHALANCSGAACLVHRCRLPAKVAGAVVLSRCSEACEQFGCWAHGMRRVEELYLKAVRSELGQPAGELQYPAHQRAVPCLAVQHEQPPGGSTAHALLGAVRYLRACCTDGLGLCISLWRLERHHRRGRSGLHCRRRETVCLWLRVRSEVKAASYIPSLATAKCLPRRLRLATTPYSSSLSSWISGNCALKNKSRCEASTISTAGIPSACPKGSMRADIVERAYQHSRKMCNCRS